MSNSLKKQLIKYFLEELQPIKIYASIKEWKKIKL